MSLDQFETTLTSHDHLSFLVGDECYCLDISLVREIRSWSVVTPLPHAPNYLRGVVNLRGTVLPIIDLGQRLGLSETKQGHRSVIIVVSSEDQTYGILVHAVSDILSIPSEHLKAPPRVPMADGTQYLQAVAVLDGLLIKVLNLEVVLPCGAADTAKIACN